MKEVQPIRDIKMVGAIREKLFEAENRKGHPENGHRNVLLFLLGCNSALRISDLLALTIGDVWDGKRAKRVLSIVERKTGKPKSFALSDFVQVQVRNYISTYRKRDPLNAPLFASRKEVAKSDERTLTGAIGREHALRILQEAAAAAGYAEPLGTHSMRKTFGYHLFQRGYSIEMIMRLLNHSSPRTTLRYIGISREEEDQAYQDMGAILADAIAVE